MKYLGTLREGEHTSDIYLCKSKQIAKTKAGKTYYSLVLQDKTGTADGKIWELGGGIDHFEALDYIKIEADVTVFQGANQLNIRRVRRAGEGEYVPEDYLPTSRYSIGSMYEELKRNIAGIKNPYLRKLLESFFIEDEGFKNAFCKHSAAKSVHHGFVGGLLEHTLSVVKLCDFYCVRYSMLDRDLLLCAAMLHDIGKVRELSDFPENDYTDDGQLLGHIVMGVEMVGRHIEDIPDFPPKMGSQLKHCILAHHGEYEYGSPKKPALAEALALNFADNTDAKLETMREILESADGEGWLGYNRLFESNLRKTRKAEDLSWNTGKTMK